MNALPHDWSSCLTPSSSPVLCTPFEPHLTSFSLQISWGSFFPGSRVHPPPCPFPSVKSQRRSSRGVGIPSTGEPVRGGWASAASVRPTSIRTWTSCTSITRHGCVREDACATIERIGGGGRALLRKEGVQAWMRRAEGEGTPPVTCLVHQKRNTWERCHDARGSDGAGKDGGGWRGWCWKERETHLTRVTLDEKALGNVNICLRGKETAG